MTEQEIRRALDGLVQRLRDRHWQECDCDLEGEEKTCKSQSLRDANAVAATLRALLEARELLAVYLKIESKPFIKESSRTKLRHRFTEQVRAFLAEGESK